MVLITHNSHFQAIFHGQIFFLYCRFWVIWPWPRPSGNPASNLRRAMRARSPCSVVNTFSTWTQRNFRKLKFHINRYVTIWYNVMKMKLVKLQQASSLSCCYGMLIKCGSGSRPFNQCCGSGSYRIPTVLWRQQKKTFFPSFSAYYFLKTHLHPFSKIKSHNEVTTR